MIKDSEKVRINIDLTNPSDIDKFNSKRKEGEKPAAALRRILDDVPDAKPVDGFRGVITSSAVKARNRASGETDEQRRERLADLGLIPRRR